MKKLTAFILSALMAVAALTGCGGQSSSSEASKDNSSSQGSTGDWSYIADKGDLVIGITYFEPMNYKDENGELTGFETEFAQSVCEKLGVKANFQKIDWDSKEVELNAKTIDCIWNGLTWSEDRAQNMSMSDYYMLNRQVIVVKSENASKFSTLDALKSASVAAESGSAGEEYIQSALADATYIEKDGQKDVLTELLAGTVDAGVLDYTMANYLINKEGSDFASLVILGGVAGVEDEYDAIAFRKGSDVTAKVNALLKEMKADGTVKNLAKQYGLEDAIVD